MASATMSGCENSAGNMTHCETNGEVGVDKPIGGNLDVDSDSVREEKNLNETAEVDQNNQQFSNNATTESTLASLGIPVTDEISCKVTNPEKNIEESEIKEPQKTDKSGEAVFIDERKPSIEPPVATTLDDVTSEDNDDDDAEYIESAGDERIACIEEEYIQRISVLEQRHNELENVLERLTTAVECGIVNFKPKEVIEAAQDDNEEEIEIADTKEGATGGEPEKNEINISRGLILDLFVEFQHKIRNFAEDLNGVLNCSEAAIRHARVVQEWATSVQLMFEQLKEERHKILNYIDERERNMMVIKEQFVTELEEQGKTLKQLVEEMMLHHELQQEGEEYCKTKVGDSSSKRSTVEKIVDLLLKRRLEEDKSIIINLNKQSKISEMKLFIIHQQSCIQQLQEQNKELRAIIEGLMGPDDIEEENPCDSDQSGTPASVNSQEQCILRQTLEKQDSPSISLVSDVLYCDRGVYLPGSSTDGDVATVQAYGIGKDGGEINTGGEIVFDPLSVNYVREQCQHAEETERQAHLAVAKEENVQPVGDSFEGAENKVVQQDTGTENVEVQQDTGTEKVEVQQDTSTENVTDSSSLNQDVAVIQITTEVVEPSAGRTDEHNAAGDGIKVITEKTASPRTDVSTRNSTDNKEEVIE